MSSVRALTYLRGKTSILAGRGATHWLRRGYASATLATLRKTGLYDFHVAHEAKMVPFAGYSMPLTYGNIGQIASHNHVRNSVGIFDVGHMVQSNFRGKTATEFLEWLTPSSLSSLKAYSSTLSVLLNERGGIIDDTIITKHASDAFYVVTNAGRREEDLTWFKQKLAEWNSSDKGQEGPVEHEVLDNWGLLALQGPEAASYLQSLTSFDLKKLTFGTSAFVPIEGFNLHVARGGYTGEDGFEISIPPSQTVEVTELLSKPPVQLIGLGARDSLRLEAGMCLYGSDLDETTTPVEAGLSWVIGKERKEKGGFIGAETVLQQLKEGPSRRRVGMIIEGAPARRKPVFHPSEPILTTIKRTTDGAVIYSPSGTEELGESFLPLVVSTNWPSDRTSVALGACSGTVTSGIPSPTLGKNIAMGYIKSGWHKKGTEVQVEVRKQLRKAVLTPMPFTKPNYWRG